MCRQSGNITSAVCEVPYTLVLPSRGPHVSKKVTSPMRARGSPKRNPRTQSEMATQTLPSRQGPTRSQKPKSGKSGDITTVVSGVPNTWHRHGIRNRSMTQVVSRAHMWAKAPHQSYHLEGHQRSTQGQDREHRALAITGVHMFAKWLHPRILWVANTRRRDKIRNCLQAHAVSRACTREKYTSTIAV